MRRAVKNSEDRFRVYLREIGDDLLSSVAADLAGLAALFRNEPPCAIFLARREACRTECLRRGRPGLFRTAPDPPPSTLNPAA